MTDRSRIAAASLIVLIQWVVLASFIQRSLLWWLKANQPAVSAGVVGAGLFLGGSCLAVYLALSGQARAQQIEMRLRFFGLLVGSAGLAGLLVFFGMLAFGHIYLVER